eukprot:CAMPEP_0194435148 /NCGR_PEP_ID=MMETSP0176-20130528/86987_1 /TAXON_ID=216777 /ORGANISM="Proboscia alata, Strain PI-D3" /LENGTH=83 /DNA_ID=CAMNT_0039254105 /DNA_START=39 /DNA_END=287 /DNA_ORIENTATION=-
MALTEHTAEVVDVVSASVCLFFLSTHCATFIPMGPGSAMVQQIIVYFLEENVSNQTGGARTIWSSLRRFVVKVSSSLLELSSI